MSKLYDALKRLDKNKQSLPNLSKKSKKNNIKWVILFFVSILFGTFLLHLSDIIGTSKAPIQSKTIKIAKNFNANQTNTTNATLALQKTPKEAPILTKNQTAIQNHKSIEKQNFYSDKLPTTPVIAKQNNIIADNATKAKQLNNTVAYQQDKGEKLANLALNINQSIEQNDLYRAKLLLKEYLSIQEDPFALNDLAGIYIEENQFTQAAKLLNQSIKIEPSAAAYINIIYCYKKLNETNRLNNLLKTINPAMFNEQQKGLISSIINSK